MKDNRTIVVVGTGVVALYTAVLLARRIRDAPRLVLVGNRPEASKTRQRDLFINFEHRQRIASFGVESFGEVETVKQISLAIDGWDGGLEFTGGDLAHGSAQCFGVVAPMASLRQALFEVALAEPRIEFIDECARPCPISLGTDACWQITLGSGQSLSPDLLVCAERDRLTSSRFAPRSGSFSQIALSGVLRFSRKLNHCAWQLFLDGGPLAILPLPQPYHGSYIWTLDADDARAVASLSQGQRESLLSEKLNQRFGEVAELSVYQPAPLGWQYHRHLRWAQMVLLGEAARTVHPMAGIGANLGMYSGAWLAGALSDWSINQPRPSLLRWEREVYAYGQLLHSVLVGIRRLSPLLDRESLLSPALRLFGENACRAIGNNAWLRGAIVGIATGSGMMSATPD